MINAKNVTYPELKIVEDDFEVDFGVELDIVDTRQNDISSRLDEIDSALASNNSRLSELNNDIARLTNTADGIDYMVAVGSGVLAGIIDSFWVGEFSLERGNDRSHEKTNNFVVKIAQQQGYEGNDLQGAIRYLEKRYGAPSDSNTSDLGGGLQHHLRDFAHHPTIVGLLFSLVTQFTEKAYGTDVNGAFLIVDIKDKTFIGDDVSKKILFGTVFWFFHVVSDMAGSSSSPGAGTGLPGPLLSLAKEISTLPFFRNIQIGDNSLSVWISKLFNGTLLAKRNSDGKIIESVRFDLRTELGVVHELGRQAIPVIINECIVRGFYFIRRLISELKEKEIRHFSDFERIDWHKTMPFKNRTVVRMLTIATSTFTLIDLGDAAIRAGIKSAGNPALFGKEFLLRVNFVGVGRFAVAITSDITMGIQLERRRNDRMVAFSERLHLMNAKVYYLQAGAWIAAETTEKTINEALEMMEQTSVIVIESWKANRESLNRIGEYRQGIEKKNANLIDDITDILKWG